MKIEIHCFWANMLKFWNKIEIYSKHVDTHLTHLHAMEGGLEQNYIQLARVQKGEGLKRIFKETKSSYEYQRDQIKRLQGALDEALYCVSESPAKVKEIEMMKSGVAAYRKMIEESFKKIQQEHDK